MNTRILIVAALAASLLLAGCAKPQEEAKEEPAAPAIDLAAEEQAIRTRSAEWMNYANAKDAATIANDVYAADAITVFDGTVRRGTAEILAGAQQDYAARPTGVVSWTSDQVRVASSGDLAVEIGSVTVDPDGDGKAPATRGAFVTVWAKTDGKWRAIADAGTDNEKTAEAAAPTT